GGVHQHPAVAGVHAMLEEQIAGDVVTRDSISRHCVARLVVGLGWRDVLHYQIAAGIAYPERFSFGVELCECEIFFVLPDAIGIWCAVVSNGNDLATEAIEMGLRWRVGMVCRQTGGAFVLR